MLNPQVSFFRNIKAPSHGEVQLLDWLRGLRQYDALVDDIRLQQDKDKVKALKLQLPCITPSGVFSRFSDDSIVQHSGLIAIDLDNTPPQEAKQSLSNLPWIYYAGQSVGGQGVWALIPISQPKHHSAHFRAIQMELSLLDVKIDPTCANVSRKRFYSHDKDPFFNPAASTYETTIQQSSPLLCQPNAAEDSEKIKLLLSRIEIQQTDITANYPNWLLLGGTLANLLGENGRELFHRFSQFHPHYSPAETNRQYDKDLKHIKPLTLGVIFNLATKYGVQLK